MRVTGYAYGSLPSLFPIFFKASRRFLVSIARDSTRTFKNKLRERPDITTVVSEAFIYPKFVQISAMFNRFWIESMNFRRWKAVERQGEDELRSGGQGNF